MTALKRKMNKFVQNFIDFQEDYNYLYQKLTQRSGF